MRARTSIPRARYPTPTRPGRQLTGWPVPTTIFYAAANCGLYAGKLETPDEADMGLDEAFNPLDRGQLFGDARVPAPEAGDGSNPELGKLSHYYDEARRFAHAITTRSLAGGGTRQVIVTGAVSGVIEAG